MISHKELLFFTAIISLVLAVPRTGPIVETNAGVIKGLLSDDGSFALYLGVPYGVVNKTNPFGVASMHTKFEEPFEAYDDSTICLQWNFRSRLVVGEMDCLQLNVYVPSSASSSNPLPVIVFIHGGGFTGNSKNMQMFGPSFLMRQDIILVSINYRLGVYGFMCLDIPEVSGNQGLKDQRLALRWVKENIAAFGGDVNKITLMGTSAGSMSTNIHVLFNKDKIFHQAIMQSGTAFCPVMYEPVRDLPMKIAANLDLITTDVYEALEFLANAEPESVILSFNSLNFKQRICIENKFDDIEGFVLDNWLTTEKQPEVKDMPILIGFNEEEKGMVNYFNQSPEFYENLQIVNTYLSNAFPLEGRELEEMQKIVSHFYFGNKGESAETAGSIMNFDSDFIFHHPTYRGIDNLIKNDVGNIYLYLLTYVGDRSQFGLLQSLEEGRKAVHSDENLFLFDRQGLPEITVDDQLTIDRMTTLWGNFAKYGNPTPFETSDLLPVKWEPITKDSVYHYMNIGKNLTTGMRPLNERMTFWDLFYKSNGYLATAYPNLD